MTVRDFSSDLAGQQQKYIGLTIDQARGWLALTDWIAVGALEDEVPMPANVHNHRVAIRDVVSQRTAQIEATTSLSQLEALVSTPAYINGVVNKEAHLVPFPEPINEVR